MKLDKQGPFWKGEEPDYRLLAIIFWKKSQVPFPYRKNYFRRMNLSHNTTMRIDDITAMIMVLQKKKSNAYLLGVKSQSLPFLKSPVIQIRTSFAETSSISRFHTFLNNGTSETRCVRPYTRWNLFLSRRGLFRNYHLHCQRETDMLEM